MKKLTYQEYIAFLLLYAAYSDLSLSRNEIDEILGRIPHKEFHDINHYILSLNDIEQINIIEFHKKQYLDTADKVENALQEICKVLLSDDKFGPVQQFYYNFLQKELALAHD